MRQYDLFELLKERSGALYISDLHYSPYREAAIKVALEQEDCLFSLAVWNDWLNYVMNSTLEPCETVSEVKHALQNLLRKNTKDAEILLK